MRTVPNTLNQGFPTFLTDREVELLHTLVTLKPKFHVAAVIFFG